MLPCKEIVRIMSSGEELSFMRSAELKLHMMMCKHCSRYSSQLKMLKYGFKKLFAEKMKVDQAEVTNLENKIISDHSKK